MESRRKPRPFRAGVQLTHVPNLVIGIVEGRMQHKDGALSGCELLQQRQERQRQAFASLHQRFSILGEHRLRQPGSQILLALDMG